jgi:hypothetical protein
MARRLKNQGPARRRPLTLSGYLRVGRLFEIPVVAIVVVVTILIPVEIEQVEQVADRRHVDGNIGMVIVDARIRKVIAAALAELAEMPVSFHELHERRVFIVDVADVTAARER